MKMRNNFVLIEPIVDELKTTSGIILSQVANEKTSKARVISVPDDCEVCISGDIILYDKFNITQVKIDGKDYAVISTSDVIGVEDDQ